MPESMVNMKINFLIAAAMGLLLLPTRLTAGEDGFVRAVGTHFYTASSESEPYYFVGTNLWYAPILASTGEGGNRERLARELDSLQSMGIRNLRILVGADRGSSNANTVKPYLQPEPGVLNDTLLDGLDYLLREMETRDMKGVFYLNNSWDWSGGFGFYLRAVGHEDSPNSNGDGYDRYCAYAAQFSAEREAQELFFDYVKKIVSRTNRYTGKAYRESPAIMAWQVCNEPRPFAADQKDNFEAWVLETARIIKEIDPNHMVSVGSEGLYGCHYDWGLYEAIHESENIDYLTIHLWPVNWGWGKRDSLLTSLPQIYREAERYIEMHAQLAEKLGKPMVIEEFGYPRDETCYEAGSPTVARDRLYSFVLEQLHRSYERSGALAGVNFWGWGGVGRADSTVWKEGDDFICDPPHEPQGWYSVFSTDTSTLELLRGAAQGLNR